LAGQFCTPVLKDGRLFGISGGGNFFCLDAKTGQKLWVSTDRFGERGFGALVAAGPSIMALISSGELIVFNPSDKAYEEVARMKVSNTPTYTYPIPAGNRLFVKDMNAVMMYGLE
jgi:outer membrane protein assembly factor BamB